MQLLAESNDSSHDSLGSISDLIPGLIKGSGGQALPVWPNQFFMTCTMSPVNRGTPLSTEMTYNWLAKSQRTRMFAFPESYPPQSVIDAQLIRSKTWIFPRNADGTFTCDKTPLSFGPVGPNWATQGGGKIHYIIKNNPQLSPNTLTICFSAPINPPGQFWIWYKTGDLPVVFCQTQPKSQEGTNLALADYNSFQMTNLIDPDTFNVPTPCQNSFTEVVEVAESD